MLPHINELPNKEARTIATQWNGEFLGERGEYHHCVYRAAVRLDSAGLGCFVYYTQWSSGKTLWKYGEATVSVDFDGVIGG